MKNTALQRKPDAGNPHVRFDEGEVALVATPRRGVLPCRRRHLRQPRNLHCRLWGKLWLLSAMMFAGMAVAEDVIVNAGETRTLSGEQEYGSIFVNGTLTIEEDANITAGSFIMASGAVENVSFTLGRNATLKVTGAEQRQCAVGMGEGYGTAVLEEGAQFLPAKQMCVGVLTATNIIPAGMITIHLKPQATIKSSATDSRFLFFAGQSKGTSLKPKSVLAAVTLDDGAVLDFSSMGIASQPYARINFNGGWLRQSAWNSSLTAMVSCSLNWTYPSAPTWLYFTSIDGNPIKLEQNTHAHHTISIGGNGTRIQFEGDGDVVFCGTWRTANTNYRNALFGDNSWSIYFNNGGDVRLEGRRNPRLNTDATSNARRNPIPEDKVLRIAEGASLDLNGYTITNAQLVCDGELYSRYTSLTGTVVVTGGSTTNSTIANITTNIAVRKEGAGSLAFTANAADIAALDIVQGTVSFTGISTAAKTTTVERLSMSADTSLTSDGRTFIFNSLEMDGSASAAVGTFAAVHGAAVRMDNMTPKGVMPLPFAFATATGKENLDSWTVVVNGAPCDKGVFFHQGRLRLGRPGVSVIIR